MLKGDATREIYENVTSKPVYSCILMYLFVCTRAQM